MTGENLIKKPVTQMIRHKREVNQEKPPFRGQRRHNFQTHDSHSNDFQIVSFEENVAIGEPRAAGRGKAFFVIAERNAARVFVIARATVNWRLDSANAPAPLIREAAG